MFLYFWKRLLHKKNFYLALLAGAMLSMLYIAKDVYPYRALKYGHSVYTIWMGGFNGSIYASLFYLLVPLLAAIPMADTWLSDRQSGYYQFVQTRNKTKQYFRGLYVCNFTAGGLVTIFPLAINLYACFLLVPDEKPDLILWDTHTVSLYGKETLFPSVFYDYPLLHICLFLFFAFCIGGLLAGVALAFSGLLKNIFMVWVSVFVLNYLYESLAGIVCKNGAATYYPLTYAHQVAPLGEMELSVMVTLMILLLGITIIGMCWGAKRHELD